LNGVRVESERKREGMEVDVLAVVKDCGY